MCRRRMRLLLCCYGDVVVVVCQAGKEDMMLRDWLDCCVTDGGLLVAQQRISQPPILVKQMMDEWLERYDIQI